MELTKLLLQEQEKLEKQRQREEQRAERERQKSEKEKQRLEEKVIYRHEHISAFKLILLDLSLYCAEHFADQLHSVRVTQTAQISNM